MPLSQTVRIAPRFQRAVRIDSDIGRPEALQGFLCTATFARAISTICDQFQATGHGAYTVTGPFGGGKSSLVVALASAVGARGPARELAQKAFGPKVQNSISRSFKPSSKGWRVIPVLGARRPPSTLVADALLAAGLWREPRASRRPPSDADVLDTLKRAAKQPTRDGIVLIIDELGKVLEHLSSTGGDLQFFQDLAEIASRSDRRFLVLGVLHQAFDEYVGRVGRDVRDEWAKVQGRYLDIPLSVTGSEQIDLLSRAIMSERVPPRHAELTRSIGTTLRAHRLDAARDIEAHLRKCWPLHPVTACLLGATSRRRFGQNQRSLFGFLNSYEAYGFQDFIGHYGADDLYTPARLFDYLRSSLEPAILASPDGHRWSIAVDALERVEKRAPSELHISIIKSIALLDLFRERSGLFSTEDVLRTLDPRLSRKQLSDILADLVAWSVVSYRAHLSGYSLFAGSDFDVQSAIDDASTKIDTVSLSEVRSFAGLRPIVAKRHYHETGALRWFDIDVVALADLSVAISAFKPNGSMGLFLLVVPTKGESAKAVRVALKAAAASTGPHIVLGSCRTAPRILTLAQELAALEYIRKHRGELASDPVARREVEAKQAAVLADLEGEVRASFSGTTWHTNDREFDVIGMGALSRLGSDLADAIYHEAPRIHNELLNRSTPSSNAVAAQKALLKCMVTRPQTDRLGIVGYPAEGGLYESLLARTGLHVCTDGLGRFAEPARRDAARLLPLWKATDKFLERAIREPVSAAEIYALWGSPPFGLRAGLRPVILLTYLLTRLDRYTVYLQNSLEAELTDLTVDWLVQDPAHLTLRIFDPNERERRLLSGVRDTVSKLLPNAPTPDLDDAVGLGRGLVAIVKAQPTFAQRTTRLSTPASAIRAAIRSANDPHVLLHETLPAALDKEVGRLNAPVADLIETLRCSLVEISNIYNETLRQVEATLFDELGAQSGTSELPRLHERAARLRGVTGDFRLEALVARLMAYTGTLGDIEGIASLAANKPASDWTDSDADRATMEVADLAQRFNRAEAFARVKGREDGRHSVAFVVGLDHSPEVAAREFEITDMERRDVLKLARGIRALTDAEGVRQEIILAAIAHVGSELLIGDRRPREQSGVDTVHNVRA